MQKRRLGRTDLHVSAICLGEEMQKAVDRLHQRLGNPCP